MTRFQLNGAEIESESSDDTLLLIVLREELGLTGTKYGCGAAQCGACTVHIDGVARYSCQTTLAMVADAQVTTIEGLNSDLGDALKDAWVAEQTPQCGYCQPGQIMKAAELLAQNSQPTRDEIRTHMSANLCRCGTYPRIANAVARAAQKLG